MSKYLPTDYPKALKNGIFIDDIYQVEGKYVYQGSVLSYAPRVVRLREEGHEAVVDHVGEDDSIKTRWITNNQWDGKGSFRMVSGKMLYTDGNDNEMKVLEEDDDEWEKYDNPNTVSPPPVAPPPAPPQTPALPPLSPPPMTTNRRINRRNDMELWYQQESGSNGMQDWMYDSETDDYFGPGPAALRDD